MPLLSHESNLSWLLHYWANELCVFTLPVLSPNSSKPVDHTAVHSGLPCGSPSSPSLDCLNLLIFSLSNHQGSWHLLSTCNLQELPSSWSELNNTRDSPVQCRDKSEELSGSSSWGSSLWASPITGNPSKTGNLALLKWVEDTAHDGVTLTRVPVPGPLWGSFLWDVNGSRKFGYL